MTRQKMPVICHLTSSQLHSNSYLRSPPTTDLSHDLPPVGSIAIVVGIVCCCTPLSYIYFMRDHRQPAAMQSTTTHNLQEGCYFLLSIDGFHHPSSSS
jgi:hypothetical protein